MRTQPMIYTPKPEFAPQRKDYAIERAQEFTHFQGYTGRNTADVRRENAQRPRIVRVKPRGVFASLMVAIFPAWF